MKNNGKFIPPGIAKKQISNFIEKVLKPRGVREDDAVIGNLFSLSEVQGLLQKMNKWNNTHGGTPREVTGIRVYNGWNENSPNSDKSTVFLVGVQANGKDVCDVYNKAISESAESTDTDPLGEPKPCPNYC